MRSPKDFLFEVSRGVVAYHTHVNKFGRNTDVDSAAAEDIWDGGGTWAAPTEARTHAIASDDANDDGDPAGTGARTLRIYGLTDWDTAEVSEDITLNGITSVNTANDYVIIHRMKVLTFGSAGPNVGTITATAQTDATVTAQINPMEGQTQMAIYGVPSVQTAYLMGYYASFNKSGGAAGSADISLRMNPIPGTSLAGFLVKHTQGLVSTGASLFHHEPRPPEGYPGPFIMKTQAAASANDLDISAGFDLVLVTN